MRAQYDTGSKQEIDFSGTVKTFIYPDAYVQKFLTPDNEAAERIIGSDVTARSELASVTKDLTIKKAAFEKKQADFDKKWIKNAKAVEEVEDDEQ